MAIIQNPLIGRAKRQAGGMVFQTVFEKNIMRSKPFIYRDKKSAFGFSGLTRICQRHYENKSYARRACITFATRSTSSLR